MSFELLDTAELLLSRQGGPSPADACRAISTTYYALFHCLAKSCCDQLVGYDPPTRPQRAWDHLYRSLTHTSINERFGKPQAMMQKGFSPDLVEFARFVRNMQWKRERCDYAHDLRPNVSAARNDIAIARGHLRKFQGSSDNEKTAFAVYLLFKDDRHDKKFISV